MQLYKTKFILRLRSNFRKHKVDFRASNVGGKLYMVRIIEADLSLWFNPYTVRVFRLGLRNLSYGEGMRLVDEIYHGRSLPAVGQFLFEENLLNETRAMQLFDLPKAAVKVVPLCLEERKAA